MKYKRDTFLLSHLQIKKQAHDGNAEKNAPIMQDAGTQTADFSHNSCCDVSVQCSLIQANSINSTSVHTTRRQSVHFNEVSAGASATKVQAQTQPKLPKGLCSRKSHRLASMKKTPILKRPLRKGLGINTVSNLMWNLQNTFSRFGFWKWWKFCHYFFTLIESRKRIATSHGK